MKSIQVTVLGSSAGYATPGRACSGYLIQSEEDALVLDLGAGAFANLQKHITVDADFTLVISHLHHDHYTDILGLYTARRFWIRPLKPLTVFVPPGGEGFLLGMGDYMKDHFDFRELKEGRSFEVGRSMEINAYKVDHSKESYAIRLTVGETTVAYSSDTGYCENLVKAARGADLFICETTFTVPLGEFSGLHLSGSEAGLAAGEAGAERLMITHFWPTLDSEQTRNEAQKAFGGEVIVAEEGLTIEV